MEWREKIISRTPEEIRKDFAEVLKNWQRFPGNDDPSRTGCVCTILDDTTADLVMPQEFLGEIPVAKSALYAFYSLEMAIRIGDHQEQVTSAASAFGPVQNSAQESTSKKYSGATRCPGFLRFSTSGFTGAGDQAFSAAMQDRAGLLTDELLDRIEKESNSPLTRAFVLYDREHR
ncbi:MAG: hypothetical protein V1778_00550 [bacterium]